jgi:hypothetical protein
MMSPSQVEYMIFVFFYGILLILLLKSGAPWWLYPPSFVATYLVIILLFGSFGIEERRKRRRDDERRHRRKLKGELKRELRKSSRQKPEERQQQKARCELLLKQAFHACAEAAGHPDVRQKSWKAPEHKKVKKALFASEGVPEKTAFAILLKAWRSGPRDRELALHLMFRVWSLQGSGDIDDSLDLQTVHEAFKEPYDYLGGKASDSGVFLLAAGHMISLFDHRTGLTLDHAEACLKRFLKLFPHGIPAAEFERRGDFGDYFLGRIAVHKTA